MGIEPERRSKMDPLKELDGFDAGQQLALLKKLGGKEVKDAILRGEKIITVGDAIRLLFDKHGRRIPEGFSANVCDANRDFRLDQPKLEQEVDYANRILRLHGELGVDTAIIAKQFQQETERLLALIRDNSQVANIANGVWLPVVLPQLTTDDLGIVLEQYLEAVGKSYVKTFSDRKLYNHRKGTLASEVSIVAGSRHNQLIAKMKQEPVIGIHFPNPLQGYSINAQREQMSTLSEGFILSGLDTAIAMAMYPDILARDWNTPGLDLAAFSWRSAACSLYFRASDGRLDFDSGENLACAYGYYSGGLLFLG